MRKGVKNNLKKTWIYYYMEVFSQIKDYPNYTVSYFGRLIIILYKMKKTSRKNKHDVKQTSKNKHIGKIEKYQVDIRNKIKLLGSKTLKETNVYCLRFFVLFFYKKK